MKDSRLISDPVVAEFLSDRSRSRHLDPFLAREATVAEAAHQLGLSPQRMHYWVRRLLVLELVTPVRTEVRGRSRTVIYRSSADSYSLPLELLPTGDLETLGLYFQPVWDEFLRAVATAGRKYADGWLVRFSRVGEKPAFHIVPATAPQPDLPFTNNWARLELTTESARSFRRELEDLLQRYLELPPDPRSRPFLAHVALVEAERK